MRLQGAGFLALGLDLTDSLTFPREATFSDGSPAHGASAMALSLEGLSERQRAIRALALEAKRRIAARCAALIPDGSSLFINIGTTTEEMARALTGRCNRAARGWWQPDAAPLQRHAIDASPPVPP